MTERREVAFDDRIRIADPPPYVGYYRLGHDVLFWTTHRPALWHRFWTRVFLGWVWVEPTR